MKFAVTPEDIVKFGEFLEGTRFEKGIIKRKLKELTPQERLEGLEPERVLSLYNVEERLKGLDPEERLKGLEPEERLKGIELEERLKDITPEAIEAYLQKIKSNKSH